MWCIAVTVVLLASIASAKVAVLPHDVYPGFEVTHFQNGKHNSNYRLLETGFSKYFTVLDNGIVMTTSDLGPLVNRPVNLVVLEELANKTETHDLHLYVINRRNMLTFTHDQLGEGEILENSLPGMMVEGFPILRARGKFPVHYTILPEDDGDRPFVLSDIITKEIGYNLTLRNHKQGVRVISTKPLDRERKKFHKIVIHASDNDFISSSKISGIVQVLDENDNNPIFENPIYTFEISPINLKTLSKDIVPHWKRFSTIGKVSATDADGDKLAYKLLTPNNMVIIVPQTGELLLAGEPEIAADEDEEWQLLVEAHDLRLPSRISMAPARVIVRLLTSAPIEPEVHKIQKRRVTRAVRPTKKIEFTEADGDIEGKIAFYLEKETERETYKIRDENKWVTVGSNGSVRVKQKWDYEELGPEKTIDFWVTIHNAGNFYLFLNEIRIFLSSF